MTIITVSSPIKVIRNLSFKLETSVFALNVINYGKQNYFIQDLIAPAFSVLYMQSLTVMCFEFLSIFHLL